MNIAIALLLVVSQDEELKKVLELQEKVRACCEKVRPAYVFFGNGSGVCISADGWVLTNFHVSGDKSGQQVRMTGGKRFTADVVGFDPHGDIALCRIKNAKDLPFLGIRAGEGNPDVEGIQVADVMKDSPAEKAGIKKEDVLVELAGVKITDSESLEEALEPRKIGEEIELKVMRKGKDGWQEKTFKLKLEGRAEP